MTLSISYVTVPGGWVVQQHWWSALIISGQHRMERLAQVAQALFEGMFPTTCTWEFNDYGSNR